MTTTEAFEALLKSPPRGLPKLLGKYRNYVQDLKKNHKANKVSTDLMEEILTVAGWKKKPEKWSKPKEEIK